MDSPDYNDLPLDELRALNDPTKYGWKEVFRNPLFIGDGYIQLPLTPNVNGRWDCGFGARRIADHLSSRGIEASLVCGTDEQRFFQNHVWVELADGRVIDPTPGFKFTGSKHQKREKIEGEKPTSFSCYGILPYSRSPDLETTIQFAALGLATPFTPREHQVAFLSGEYIDPNKVIVTFLQRTLRQMKIYSTEQDLIIPRRKIKEAQSIQKEGKDYLNTLVGKRIAEVERSEAVYLSFAGRWKLAAHQVQKRLTLQGVLEEDEEIIGAFVKNIVRIMSN